MDKLGLSIYNQIIYRYLYRLNMVEQISSIDCNIHIDKIYASNIDNNCIINIINRCVSDQTLSVTLLYQSLADVLSLLDSTIRSTIEDRLGITVNDIQNNNNTGIIADCKTYASVNSSIDVGLLEIKNCKANKPLYFNFINSGSVEANCGLSAINESLIVNELFPKQKLQTIFNLNMYDYILLFLISICFMIILCCLVFMFKNKYYIKFVNKFEY